MNFDGKIVSYVCKNGIQRSINQDPVVQKCIGNRSGGYRAERNGSQYFQEFIHYHQ